MARIGVLCCHTGEDLTDEEALKHAKGIGSGGIPCLYTYEMMAGMLDGSGRETAHYSATMLTGCKRQARLKVEEDYRIYPQRSFAAFRGTLGHLLTEHWPEPGYLYEKRFEIQFPDFPKPFTGQIDKLGIRQKAILDFKTKADAKVPTEADPDHIWQLNMYRYLVKYGWPQEPFLMRVGDTVREFGIGEPANIEINSLTLCYWSMAKVKIVPVPIIPYKEVEAFIKEGLAVLVAEETPEIPEDLDPFIHPLCVDWCPVQEFCAIRMLSGR